VPVGFAPVVDDSDVAITWDLPLDLGRALDVALRASPDRVPLVRDDQGGRLVGLAASATARRGLLRRHPGTTRPREDDPRGARRQRHRR